MMSNVISQRADSHHAADVMLSLQGSESSLNAIFDASPDAILICDEHGAIVMASRQTEAILGYSSAELIGQPIEVLLPPEHRRQHSQHRAEFIVNPQTRLMGQRGEIKALRKDGRQIDVEIGLSRIKTAQGTFVASALRDVSARKMVEAALRENEEKLRSLFVLSPLGIAMTDMDGKFLEFNEAFRAISGYSESELKAIDYWHLTPKKFEAAEAQQLESLSRTGRYGPYEKEYIHKDGRKVPLRLNGVLVTARDGSDRIWSIVEDITEQKATEDEIRRLAFCDVTTGLPNRVELQRRFSWTIPANADAGAYGAVILIDLDNFKSINDTRGHSVGDMLLKAVAARLITCIGGAGTVYRWGGDEFVVVLDQLGEDEADAQASVQLVSKKILDALNRRIEVGADTHQCSASLGAALFANRALSFEMLMQHADMAMYKAKAAGRNTARLFDPAMAAALIARSTLENDLRQALDHCQFQLYFQPQVAGDGRLIGAEALLRWHHPQRGLVSPAEFIPVAEETGLILPLGQWVLENTCAQLAQWGARPEMAELSIAVNVSVHQFTQPDFVEQIIGVLKGSGANPRRLKLELTESALVMDIDGIVAKMGALKSFGVVLSIDDFGTGYSCLSYLKKLPLGQLKIDRSFVQDVLTDPSDAAIAQTVVALAHSLGLSVIAEGVETVQQRDFLSDRGCHAFQGFLFSRPLPLEEFEQFATADARAQSPRA
jgi:diguanylate cyclase (GGDEF)-like protein/PAS domain S-box-containing protein